MVSVKLALILTVEHFDLDYRLRHKIIVYKNLKRSYLTIEITN